MISSLTTVSPFGRSGVSWCSAAFEVQPDSVLTYSDNKLGGFHIALPSSLVCAVARRRSDYLAGRLCAAVALRQLGQCERVAREDVGIGMPIPEWPTGTTGSITHAGGRAVAAVSCTAAALGVDYEKVVKPKTADEIKSIILTAPEEELRPATLNFAAFVTLVFSAKEALYKALFGTVRRIIEFNEVTLCAMSDQHLQLSFAGQHYTIQWHAETDACLTLAVFEQSALGFDPSIC